MQVSRTRNTTRNATWGVVEKIVQMVLPFITRTLILKLIGEQYLGLNSLFTSIISVLNMADLGFGAAITYTMYRPIAEDDMPGLCSILNFYKKVYRVIGTAVLAIGLIIMPFLPHLINGSVPADINLYVLFSIYLANTVLSYWLFAYKKSLLHAYHRDDVNTKIATALHLLQYALQIAVLVVFDNYYAYVIVLPAITLLNNITCAYVTKRMYPQVLCRGTIDKTLAKGIKRQVSGAFIGKICGATRNSLDSVFISSFLNLTQVAIYSNYYYILGAVHNLMNVFTTSMVGGVGNSIVKESLDKNYRDFSKFTFLYSWIAGWCSCCLLCLYQPFMRLWVGNSLIFPSGTMVLFCIYLYIMAASDIKNVYYTARGLWWEGRWRALLEVLLNLILNFVGAKYFGIFGILMATIITMLLVNFLYGSKILFDNYFTNASLSRYILQNVLYLVVTVAVSAVTYGICSLLPDRGFLYLFIKAGICLFLPNLLFLAAFCKTAVFADAKPLIQRILRGVTRKLKRR